MIPKISIIMPVYKVEKYLVSSIESILNQSLREFELILVDDGSPDKCGDICDEYANKDSRIQVIHQLNGGLSKARNIGLDKARGEYIGFVDSDDTIHPRMYEVLYKASTRTLSDISICEFEKVYTLPNKYKELSINKDYKCLTKDEALIKMYNGTFFWNLVMNKLYKRELFINYRFKEGIIFEDMQIMPQLIYESNKVVCIPDKLYYYYQRDGSILHTRYSIKQLDKIEVLKERMEFAKTNNLEKFLINTQLAYAECIWWNYEEAKKDMEETTEIVNILRKSIKLYLGELLNNPLLSLKHKMVLILFIIYPNTYEIILKCTT